MTPPLDLLPLALAALALGVVFALALIIPQHRPTGCRPRRNRTR